jgi:hypothetical protein
MECEFNRTLYKRRFDNYSGHEHLIASMQLRKYSEDTLKMEFRGLKDAFRSTRKLAELDYKELESLSNPDIRDCTRGLNLTG